MGPRRGLPEGEGPLSPARRGRSSRSGGRSRSGRPSRSEGAGRSGAGKVAGAGAPDSPPETLFLATIPGATPSKWVERFTSRQRRVQLVNHDDAQQTDHLRHDAMGEPLTPLPQLGYLRWPADAEPADVLRAAGVEPQHVHVVRLYEERPVVCVGREHLLAAWDVDADGPVPLRELVEIGEHERMDPARFAPAPAGEDDGDVHVDPMHEPEVPGAGERMALEIVASGAGYTVLPMSVARMFGRRDVVVLPLHCALDDGVDDGRGHPGWAVGLAWLKAADSELVQQFVGVSRGRRASSSR